MFYILEKVWKFSKWKIKNKQSALHLSSVSALFPFVTLFISQQFIWLLSPFYVSSVKPILFSSFSAFYCIGNFFLLVAYYILFLRWYPWRLIFLFSPPLATPWGMQDLSSLTRDQTPSPAVKVRSPNHYTPGNSQDSCCCCCCPVAKLCLTPCDPMNCTMPGFPHLHRLPEISQTLVHWVGDAIQPSHPLLSPSPLAFSLSQHHGLFQWVNSSHQVGKVLELQLQHQFFQGIFRVDFL